MTLVECLVDQDRHAEAVALPDRVFEVLGPVAPADLASLAELRAGSTTTACSSAR
ncbi:hypothetical protein OV203_05795 [Nannocystis sp. ILAH1]|uniref:hypothetical protein n=1 Tax=unclassified Nannocystis TaxID=2627009 RepID=UPI002271238C|nr:MULTISPECIES: hypothetical protein [unclassified Nannocystis]MCY0986622.1 hypothetical protein [Nannocystis sp. ILAH1]MCY1071503.1 hypothetical protein [Nannocystis sp. RBIL2]